MLKRRLNARSGFTLVEVIVAVTIFSVIAVGIGATFYSGMKIWSRATAPDISNTDLIIVMEKMSRELRQSIYIPQAECSGSDEEFSFVSINDDGVLKITYTFAADEQALYRSQAGLEDAVGHLEGGGVKKKALSVEALSFKYLEKVQSQVSWIDEWPKENGQYLGLKVTGKVKGEEFSRTIFIPAS